VKPIRIIADDVSLVRGGRVLAERLSFTLAPGAYGEITGPNGAGKTTLLRCLAGLGRLGGGTLRFETGDDVLDPEERRQHLHWLGHRDGLKPAIAVKPHLSYWRGLLGDGAEETAALDRVGLGALVDLPARTLSQGQSRRLALSRLVAIPRPVWLLDEPAAGLDRSGKALLAALIESHRAAGGIVAAAVHEPLGPTPSLGLELGG
jgi:heme exporter protein A